MASIIIFGIAFAVILFIVIYGIIADDKTSQLNFTDEDLKHITFQRNFTAEDLKHITFHGVGGTRMDWNHLLSRPAVKKQVEKALKHYKENEEK